MASAVVTALSVYPVKSCRGIALDRAELTSTGLRYDRQWMVVSDSNRFMTQRELPRMALVQPVLVDEVLRLRAPGMPDFSLPVAGEGSRLEVTIWRDRCAALDQGDSIAEWFSQFLGRTARLVRFDPAGVRPSDSQWTGQTPAFSQFADGFSVLVISEASLEDLNARLATLLPMNRFRPNIVLGGLNPYDEDRIHELAAANVRLRLVKSCARCKITTTDQETGEVVGVEPLKTLKEYRWNAQLRGVMFGQNGIVVGEAGAWLAVGQNLEVIWT